MAFLRNVAWPQHSIENQEKWPEDRSLNCNTILQLDLYCKTLEKWIQEPISTVPYGATATPNSAQSPDLKTSYRSGAHHLPTWDPIESGQGPT